jgi:hypothetical protein
LNFDIDTEDVEREQKNVAVAFDLVEGIGGVLIRIAEYFVDK